MGRTKAESEKAHSIRITQQALQSIAQIIGYIADVRHEPMSAIRVVEKIHLTFNRIERNPSAFRECEEIKTHNKIYRKANCLSWVIIYKIHSNEIVILDIFHGSRQSLRIKTLRKIK